MDTVKVRNVVIGEGMPKICVPITAATKEGILAEALGIKNLPADLVEWRADCFEQVFEEDKVKEVLAELADVLKDIPLLFTFRSAREGGAKDINIEDYININKAAISNGMVDLIDAELSVGEEAFKAIAQNAHHHGVKIVASSHDFHSTPPKDEMVSRLRKMQDLGADILKIAVMPKSKLDVLELLVASVIMLEKYADKPIAAMSMSELGSVSRITGEIFGSAITFGAGKKASAPGQLEADELYQLLKLINRTIG